jgi:hypothetical protein
VKGSAAVFAVVFATLGAPAMARSSPSAGARTGARTLELIVAGSADDARTLESSLDELVKRLGLEMRVTTLDRADAEAPRFSSSSDVAVRGFIDLRSQDYAVIMLSDPTSNRPVKPRRVDRQGSRALFIEEVAYVTHVGAESLLSGEPEAGADDVNVSAAREPAKSTPVIAAPARSATEGAPSTGERAEGSTSPPRTSQGPRINLATFATGEPIAKENGVVLGGGLGGQLVLGGPSVPTIWLLGEYHVPFGNSDPIELTAYVWSLRLIPTWQLVQTRRVVIEGGIGGGADFFIVSSSAAPGATPGLESISADRNDVSPILAATLGAHVVIGPSLSVFAAGLVDWDFMPRSYVAAVGNAHSPILQTRVPRPGFMLGFSFNLLGGGGS